MKRSKLLIAVCLCLSFISVSWADEIILNLEGQPILLKDNHTWSVVDTSGDENKVVFTITKAWNYFDSQQEKDDFGDHKEYTNWVGCGYSVSAHNRTKYRVAIKKVEFRTRNTEIFNRRRYTTLSWKKRLQPGEKMKNEGSYYDSKISAYAKSTKLEATLQEKRTFYKKYGCKAQSGSLYIKWAQVEFSEDSGISKQAARKFIIGDPNGLSPLQREMEE